MIVSVIVAVADDRAIGVDNKMPWHITEDLQHFKRVTMGAPVVMGRKTFESLRGPLPGRRNIVITRNKDYSAEGIEVVYSLEDAIKLCEGCEELFIMGGGEIYRQAMPIADRFYLTRIYATYENVDTYFPEWDESEWRAESIERHERGSKFPHPFEFINYVRVRE